MNINDLIVGLNRLFPKYFTIIYPTFVDFLEKVFISYYFSFGFNRIIKLLSFFIKNKNFINDIDESFNILKEDENDIIFKTRFPIEILGDLSLNIKNNIIIVTNIKKLDKVNMLYKGTIYTKFEQSTIKEDNKIIELYILRNFINLCGLDYGFEDYINFRDLLVIYGTKNEEYIRKLYIEKYNTNILDSKVSKYNKNTSVFYYVNK